MPSSRSFLAALIVGAAVAATAGPWSARAQSPAPSANLLDCMIQPHQVVQVGSASPGIIERVLVDRGDVVAIGQPIVQLNASVERAAVGAQELAQRELERANELVEQNFVSKTYVDKQRAEAQVAGGRSDEAREKRKLATRELDLAAAQFEQRTIRAPIAGVVVERFMSPGEYVDQKPVLRLAAIDPLRVDVLVPAAAFGQVEIGRPGNVIPELFNRTQYTAIVKTVDRVIDAASNTFRVRLELPNPGGALPAGLRCKVDLALKLPEAARRGAPAARLNGPTADASVVPIVQKR